MAKRSVTRKAFLSSTGKDLAKYREHVYAAVNKLDGWKCVRMEDFGSRAEGPERVDREMVAGCDLFIGLVGVRFGSPAKPKEDEESYTQREYRTAVELGISTLMFVTDEDFPTPGREPDRVWKKQQRFREEILGTYVVSPAFESPALLATAVVTAMNNWDRGGGATHDPVPYLKSLWQATRQIRIENLRTSDASLNAFDIDLLYTALTTVYAPREERGAPGDDLQAVMKESRAAVELSQVLARPRVVLVGDPGAGKSTFLKRIAFEASHYLLGGKTPDDLKRSVQRILPIEPTPFPLLVSAPTLVGYLDKPNAITALMAAENPNLDEDFFTQRLDEGCLLMVDSLDEAGDRSGDVAKLLTRLAQTHSRTRIVATSRPGSYGGQASITEFESVEIAPLTEAAVAAFVEHWNQAVPPPSKEANLLRDVRATPEIRRMSGNPLMLTALAVLHSTSGNKLPDQRSELYASILEWLAKSRERKSGRPYRTTLSLMRALAIRMHLDERGKQIELDRFHATRALAKELGAGDEHQRIEAATEFLDTEETNSGIIVNRGSNVRFWHLTFQEYLAAEALSRRDTQREQVLFGSKDVPGKLYLPEWRETVLLLAGVLCGDGRPPVDQLLGKMLSDAKGGTLEEEARCVGLIGAILADLKAWKYSSVNADYGADYQAMLRRVMRIFDVEGAKEVPDFKTRLAAADALGQAGDPRLAPDNPDLWVRVPGGRFEFGRKGSGNWINIKPFQMGRYPVAEYRRFLEATAGKTHPKYWEISWRV